MSKISVKSPFIIPLYGGVNVKNPGAKDLDKKIVLSEDGGTISLSDIPIKAGQKQLCFYVGDSLEGNIWIDNITMKLE